MKDKKFIIYLAKLTGAETKRAKDEVCCYFPYSDDGKTYIPTHVIFNRGQSVLEFFDLTDVYNAYGAKYADYEAFVNAFVEKYDFFDAQKYNGVLCVKSDLTVNMLDHTASAAGVNYSIIILKLNEMLGRKETMITEAQWRDYHRGMLKKFASKSRLLSFCSLAAVAGGIGLAVCSEYMTTDILILVGALFVVGGIVASLFFYLRYRFYKAQYKKALRDKNY